MGKIDDSLQHFKALAPALVAMGMQLLGSGEVTPARASEIEFHRPFIPRRGRWPWLVWARGEAEITFFSVNPAMFNWDDS